MQISGTFDVALGRLPVSAHLSEYLLHYMIITVINTSRGVSFMGMLNKVITLICIINFKQYEVKKKNSQLH